MKKVTVTVRGEDVKLTEKQARSVLGQIASQVRISKSAGPGRPRTGPSCPCGAMSLKRAAARHHVCVAPAEVNE